MKPYFFFFLLVFQGLGSQAQLNINSPEYKALNVVVNSIGLFKNDKVFAKYLSRQKKNIFYNQKSISLNYLTMRQKFGIDTNRTYKLEVKDRELNPDFNVFCVKDTDRIRIARGDVIVSIFKPEYFNGYFYVMAYARNDGSSYGGPISNYLVILSRRLRIVKFYHQIGTI